MPSNDPSAANDLAAAMHVSDEVRDALDANAAVVALESTIFSHLGLPSPDNATALERCEQAIRAAGAVPAVTAVLDGVARVGIEPAERTTIVGPAQKMAERDIAVAIAGQWAYGASTVSAAITLSELAGVAVFATGGIGGVHREWATTGDISADLGALSRRRVATVCAGAKSFLDLPATLERLEQLGVPVLGYGTDEFPAFYGRRSGLPLANRVDDPQHAAAIIDHNNRFGPGATLVAVPIPAADAIDDDVLDTAIDAALDEAHEAGITGAAVTPFVLSALANATAGNSIPANLALAENNARVAAEIAVALAAR